MDQLKKRLEQSDVPWRLLTIFSLLSLVLWVITIIRPFLAIYTYLYGTVAVLYPLLTGLLCFRGMPKLLGKARSGEKPVLTRSEEHTSELQSRFDLVCRLLLEK